MHAQIRSAPVASPPDLEAFLTVLEDAGVNIVAAGGGNVERGGEFAFAVEHGEEERAIGILEEHGYHPRLVEVKTCWLTNEPGQLRRCVAEVHADNREAGRVIEDIAIGVADEEGRIPVQIYSRDLETEATAS